MSETTAQYGRLPRWWIASGRWARMKPSDLAVAGVLVVHADSTGIAWPSIETIADLAGLHRTAAIRAIRRLVELGVVDVVHGGGRGHSNRYRIIANSSTAATVSSQKTVDVQLPKERETVERRHINSSRAITKTVDARLPQQKKEQKRNRAQAAPARKADPIWDAVVKAFALNPITKADRSRVGRIVRDLKAKGATPGDIRTRLDRYRAEWPKAADTPEALLKHWDRFAKPTGQSGGDKTPSEVLDAICPLVEPPDEIFSDA